MATTAAYRQRVPNLRQRLNDMLRTDPSGPVPGGRRLVDTTGNRSRTQGFRTHEARLLAYAERRYTSVGRVCVLLTLARDSPGLALAHPEVDHAGAYWQAFGGNASFNACHTCPALLTFDGHLPTVLTTNRGLQRHLVVEFADCMLMPKAINGIDKITDETFGRDAFVAAARHILRVPKATWRDGLAVFDAHMADIYENARLILFGPEVHRTPRPAEQETMLDALCTYFEGMEASRAHARGIENFRLEVMAEARLG